MAMVFAAVLTGCGKKDAVSDTETIPTETMETESLLIEESVTEKESEDASKKETTTENSNTVAEENTSVPETTTDNTSDSNTDAAVTVPETPQVPETPETPPVSESPEAGFQTGTYRGGHKIQAMGSELPYTYSMDFKDDGTYLYQVSFVVGGETYSEEETGTYSVNDSNITMTSSDGATTNGSYSNGVVTITRRVSTFASEDATITLQ